MPRERDAWIQLTPATAIVVVDAKWQCARSVLENERTPGTNAGRRDGEAAARTGENAVIDRALQIAEPAPAAELEVGEPG